MKISTLKMEIAMVERGLTLSELAERCGISRQNLSTIRKRQTCNTSTAAKICAGLGCSVRDIVPDEEKSEV